MIYMKSNTILTIGEMYRGEQAAAGTLYGHRKAGAQGANRDSQGGSGDVWHWARGFPLADEMCIRDRL